MGERIAIRGRRGLTHAPAAEWGGSGPWVPTLCGRTLSSPERIPWESTAPEDRCRTCARRANHRGAETAEQADT